MDEFALVQKQMKDDEENQVKLQDRQFVLSVLAREKALAEQEELEKQKARQKTIEFTEALKLEMARKAESEERLIQMQHEEAERQWQKRYAQWEKEEIARRKLLEEVYTDRAEQVRLKEQVRDHVKDEIKEDRLRVDAEVGRLEEIEKERSKTEALVRQRHQEELFREMDYHQVQRHRQLQQHAIEQRQAMIAEEKYQRAMDAEKAKAVEITKEIMNVRETTKTQQKVVAPWEK
jgi:trichoplein keratin filament-binding protein